MEHYITQLIEDLQERHKPDAETCRCDEEYEEMKNFIQPEGDDDIPF